MKIKKIRSFADLIVYRASSLASSPAALVVLFKAILPASGSESRFCDFPELEFSFVYLRRGNKL